MKTDKKTECPCQEHHKHGCYFGKKPCLDCIGRNCTPQEQKSVNDTLRSFFLHKELGLDDMKSELTKLLTDELSKKKKYTDEEIKEFQSTYDRGWHEGIDEAIKTIERKLSE